MGTPDMGRFFVSDIIVHEIPKRYAAEDDRDLELSEFVVDVGDVVRNFFKERITTTITRYGVDVTVDEGRDQRVPDWVRKHLNGGADLVEMSQDMARHLFKSQDGVQPEGLLVLVDSTLEGEPALAILKLQKEEGARVQRTARGSQSSLNVEHLRELILGQKTRVFKAGLFTLGHGGSVVGWVSDEQVKEFANFFLHQFLGCELAKQPAQTTREFFVITREFINEEVAEPEQKAMIYEALQVEVRSSKDTLSTSEFIATHVPDEYHDTLEQIYADRHLPSGEFTKDTSRIKPSELKSRRGRTRKGLTITGDSNLFDELVSEDERNGERVTVIRDRIITYS